MGLEKKKILGHHVTILWPRDQRLPVAPRLIRDSMDTLLTSIREINSNTECSSSPTFNSSHVAKIDQNLRTSFCQNLFSKLRLSVYVFPHCLPYFLTGFLPSTQHSELKEKKKIFPLIAVPDHFGNRDQFHGRQFFSWTRNWGIFWGWSKCITCIVKFISIMTASAPLQVIWHSIPQVGDTCFNT